MLLFFASQVYAENNATKKLNRCAFVSNAYDYSVTQYVVDKSGDLIANGQSFSVDKFPSFVVVHPNQQWAFVSSRTVDLLRSYKIDRQNCRLSELSGEGFATKVRSPFRAVFHPSGKYLYVAGRGGVIGAFAIDLNSGKISAVPGQPFASGERTRSIAMHPSGKYVYATNAYANTVTGYRIDAKTGVLSPLKNSPYGVGEDGPFPNTPPIMPDLNVDRGPLPYYIAIHPNGKFAYVTNYVANSISQYRIDAESGELHLIGKPLKSGTTPYPIIVHPNGRFAYVATWGGSNVMVYAIDENSGVLKEMTQLQPATDMQRPVDLVFNQDASRLYVVNIGGDDIAQLSVDANSGAIHLRRRMLSRAGPITLAFSQGENFAQARSNNAYLIAADKRELYDYAINPEDGKLRLRSSIITGKDPSSVVADPKGRVVFVTNRADNDLAIYDIKSGGKLTRMKYSPHALGNAPEQLSIDANGWYIYVSDIADKSLQAFLLHKDSGEPAEVVGSPLPLTVSADILRLDPLARYTFALNKEKRLLSFNRSLAVIMAAHTPQMDYGSPMTLNFDADLMEVDRSGRYVVFADNKQLRLRPYRIHPANGSLHEMKQAAFKLDSKVLAMRFDPRVGRALLLLQPGKLQIVAFDSVFAELKSLSQLDVDASLDRLWFSADGRYVYLSGKKQQAVSILPIQVDSSDDTDRLAGIRVKVGNLSKQALDHVISDMDFSMSMLP